MKVVFALFDSINRLALEPYGGTTVATPNFARLAGHWRRRGLTPCPAVALGRTRGVVVPYGVAIACGMLFTLASQWGGA